MFKLLACYHEQMNEHTDNLEKECILIVSKGMQAAVNCIKTKFLSSVF